MSSKQSLSHIPLILLLTITQFTNFLDANMIMPLGSKLTSALGIDEKLFGVLVASYSIAAFMSGLIAILWIDRYNRRKIFLFTYFGFILGTSLCAVSKDQISVLLLARAIAGGFGGVLTSCTLALIGDIFPSETRGRALGIFMTAGPLSLVLGIPAGLWLSNTANWHWIFALISGASICCWITAYRLLPDTFSKVDHKTKNSQVIVEMLQDRKTQKLIALTIAQALGLNLILPYLSTHLVHKVGISEQQLPVVYLVTSLITILISPMAGKMSDSCGVKKTYVLWLACSAPALFLLTKLQSSSLLLVCIISSIFTCFNQGRRTVAVAVMMDVVPSKYRGCFMSLASSIQSLVLASASSMGGLILHTNSQGEFTNFSTLGAYATGALVLSAVPLLSLNLKKKPAMMEAINLDRQAA